MKANCWSTTLSWILNKNGIYTLPKEGSFYSNFHEVLEKEIFKTKLYEDFDLLKTDKYTYVIPMPLNSFKIDGKENFLKKIVDKGILFDGDYGILVLASLEGEDEEVKCYLHHVNYIYSEGEFTILDPTYGFSFTVNAETFQPGFFRMFDNIKAIGKISCAGRYMYEDVTKYVDTRLPFSVVLGKSVVLPIKLVSYLENYNCLYGMNNPKIKKED